MAKRKTGVGIIIILAAIILAVVLTPVYFIVSCLWNFIKVIFSYMRHGVFGDGIGYTEDEVLHIESGRSFLNELRDERDNIIAEGAENGVSRNVDGSFSRRSDIGKNLSRRLHENEVSYTRAENEIHLTTRNVERRSEGVYVPLVRFASYLLAVASWFLYLLYSLKLDDVSIEVLLQPYYELMSLVFVFIFMLGSGTAEPGAFKAILNAVIDSMSLLGVAFLVPIITYFISKIIFEIVFLKENS